MLLLRLLGKQLRRLTCRQDVIKGSVSHNNAERREIRARRDEVIELTGDVLKKESTLYIASCSKVSLLI